MSPHQPATAEFTKRPFLGSDQFPIHIRIGPQPTQSASRAPGWNFHKASWENWNEHINSSITLSEFYQDSEPSNKYRILYTPLMAANKLSGIKLKKPTNDLQSEPLKVWWNEDCKRAIALLRKTRNACDPKREGINCETNRAI
jgi:hypothetical protein